MSTTQDSAPTSEQRKQNEQKSVENTTISQSNTSGKAPKPRHRASVACAQCRERRIRCVVPAGDNECTQCKRSGVECVIKNDDERRRPISRAYMCSLTDRVQLLESMLKEHGAEPPPANHPPKTRVPRDESTDTPHRKRTHSQSGPKAPPSIQEEQQNSSPGSLHDDFFMEMDQMEHDSRSNREEEVESAPSPPVLLPPKKEGMVSRLLSTRGHLSFDQLSGRLRYFGATTNMHVHSEVGSAVTETRESLEQVRRAEKTIRFLSLDTHEYLMDLFWTHYNSVLHVLHQESFYEDRDQGRTQFYSGFLHICVLAMGYRFADKTRPDMQRISLPGRESTLHREAKFMLEFELERTGGIPSIVALLILGDLECGVGRDNLGWLYAGMAVRLSFDMGLHLDTRSSGLPEREVEIRHMTLWACWIYDKYWALFLGRPTSIKNSDLEIYTLSKKFERLGTCRPAGVEKSLETQIYEALLDLMELAGKITENTDSRPQSDAHVDRNAYLRMASLDRELGVWYANLPEALRWTPHNINTAPRSFFLLHQQYHTALILLHRPFASYEEPSHNGDDHNGADNHFSALSRTVCTKHAIRVARIFWHHRQRFDTKQIFVTGMQHAGTAATALVAALAFIKNSNDRNDNMQYLECLSYALQDMAYTYQPAERMSLVLQGVMAELRNGPGSSPRFVHPKGVVPARRGSCVDEVEHASFKRRQTARAKSFSTTRSNLSIDLTNLHTSMPPPLKTADADMERTEGFIMVTPQSEMSTWPHHSHDPGMSHSFSTSSTTALSTSAPRNNVNTWMGAMSTLGSDMDAQDISNIANAHFPEIMHLPDAENPNSHLDFLNLGGDDWKNWDTSNHGAVSDLDGFPTTSNGAFSAHSPPRVGIMNG